MYRRITGRRPALALVAATALMWTCAGAAHADQPAASASAGAVVAQPDLAAGVTLELWLPGAQQRLQQLLDGGAPPAPSSLADIETTLERLLAAGPPTDPRVSQALHDVLTSLRDLIERLIGDPGGTSAATLESLATRFNELSGAAYEGGTNSTSSSGSIMPPSSGTRGVQASSRVTRRRAVVVRLRLTRTRSAVRATVRCPAQAASSCQVAIRARVHARNASVARRMTIRSGSSRTIALRFTRTGRRAVRRGGRLSAVVTTRFGSVSLRSARAVSVRRAHR